MNGRDVDEVAILLAPRERKHLVHRGIGIMEAVSAEDRADGFYDYLLSHLVFTLKRPLEMTTVGSLPGRELTVETGLEGVVFEADEVAAVAGRLAVHRAIVPVTAST